VDRARNLCDEALDVLVTELLRSVGDSVDHIRHPSGRRLSALSQQLSATISKLNDEEASSLVRSITDAALFRVCYLLENDFKDSRIQVVFQRDGESCGVDGLHEKYRMLVEPGGQIES